MLSLDHTRHSGIFLAKDWSVTVIGAGGIGAITILTLAKMGVGYIEAWDGDIVEPVNVATQFHSSAMLGINKAQALVSPIAEYAPGVEYFGIPRFLTGDDTIVSRIVISALDSIEARQMVWDLINSEPNHYRWYLDARMAAQEFQLYTVNRDSTAWYQQFIDKWDDKDVPDLPCTEKATIYTASGAAGFIGATVKTIITGRSVPKIQVMNFESTRLVSV